MYKFIALMSLLIRQFYIPNPFETLEYGYSINIILELPLYLLTYNVVGLYYSKGSNSTLGSILYLIFYIIHVGLLFLMGILQWNTIAIVSIFILYIAIHIYVNIKINSIS